MARHNYLSWTMTLTLLVVCLPGKSHGGNWPRFRGPNGTGVAEDRDIPVTWKAEEGVLWKVGLPGKGHASPVVWQDHLFVQTAAPDGSSRSLLCLDAITGNLLWSEDAPGKQGRIHPRSSLASNTPAVDGERVYSLFWDGQDLQLCAYDFKGKQVWNRDLGKFTSQHGAGHSPIVAEGLVILANDQDGSAVLEAFDCKTGKDVWRVKRPAYRASYATPCLMECGDGKQELLVASTTRITGYEVKTGKERWNYTWTAIQMPLRLVASPIVADGVIVANAGDGSGARHAIAVELHKEGNSIEPRLAWENTKTMPYVPTLLARGKYLYSVTDKGIAACHEAKTGKEIWSQRLGSDVTASPILVDGKVYVVGENGKVYVFEAAPKYRLLGTSSIGEGVSATPAVANGRLYIRGDEHLYCIGKPR